MNKEIIHSASVQPHGCKSMYNTTIDQHYWLYMWQTEKVCVLTMWAFLDMELPLTHGCTG